MSGRPTPARLAAIVDRMGGQQVGMLVDLVLDRFVNGTPKRISREAPVLILRFEGEELVPGGGANAVANVAALGGVPLPVGAVGDDPEGRALLAALAERGIDTGGIRRVAGYRTPTKTRIMAGGRHAIKQQVVRYDVEDELEPSTDVGAALAAAIASWRGRATIAVLSDYGYGSVDPALVGACREAVGSDGLLLCDSRYRLPAYRGVDGATPNEEEAEGLAGGPLDDGQGLARNGERLRGELAARFLLVTRGSSGMALFEEGACARIPVHGTDEVADVTGAGDTVIATFALALAAGASPLEAALLANYAGGVVVMKRGTATLTRDELAAAIAADPAPIEEVAWARS